MDFNLSQADVEWRDRVKTFMDAEVRPRAGDYVAQQAEGKRWKVLPVVEELKKLARKAGLWNLFMPPSHGAAPGRRQFRVRRARPEQSPICVLRRGDGANSVVVGGVQLLGARHRQYGSAPPLRHRASRRSSGCGH